MCELLEITAARPTRKPPTEHAVEPGAGALEINVVYTETQPTLAALRNAGLLADHLAAKIRVIVPHVVPFPLPLDRPSAAREFIERKVRTITPECSVDTYISLYLCRDRQELLNRVLKPHSLVLIGARRSWWPIRERRLAEQLRASGHEVIVVNQSGSDHA